MQTSQTIPFLVFFILLTYPTFQIKQCSTTQFMELVSPRKYPCTTHKVHTKDGYILTMFRIQAKNTGIVKGKPAIYLQHGIISSSDDFVLNDENRALGLVLANKGYDVWLGNSRGNKYSMDHETLDINKKTYWDFSFQEMGKYDVPANIEYILQITGMKKLVLIGHSQGATEIFAALSDPATSSYVNSKTSLFIALAPVLYLSRNTNPALWLLFSNRKLVEGVMGLIQMPYIAVNACSLTIFDQAFKSTFCQSLPGICQLMITKYDNKKRADLIIQTKPDGTSVHDLLHFGQLMAQSKTQPVFRKYDYGKDENLKKYGTYTAPVYDLRKIKIPVRVFFADHDDIADQNDGELLKENCKKANMNFRSYLVKNASHFIFTYGKNPYGMFKRILRMINKFVQKGK